LYTFFLSLEFVILCFQKQERRDKDPLFHVSEKNRKLTTLKIKKVSFSKSIKLQRV
jgi:hypothetical protein